MQAYEVLETEWAKFVGSKPELCVACATGSAALHLSLEALKRPGWDNHSRCIVPEYTMVACARAVVLAGMQPVFVDCDDKLLMKTDNLPTWNVRAIQVVHVYGRQCSVGAVHEHIHFNTDGNVSVIEDMSEIHGINPHPLTDAACWSFYKNKIIYGEEGGMIAFKRPADASHARKLRSLGSGDKNDYYHLPRGHNYRLSNVHAELILDSLHRYSENEARRFYLEDVYSSLVPVEYQQPARSAVWVYDVRVPGLTSSKQDQIIRTLTSQGMAVRYGFKPMSIQPEFKGCSGSNHEILQLNAYKASQEVIYFPVYPEMTRQDVERNVSAFLEALK